MALTKIIARGINEDQSTYQEVQYSADDFHEIKIAALLHDVGKIATPEFIMQKSTKLEKVYDRIDAIKHRIEILKRDAQIEYLESQLSQTTPSIAQIEFENKIKQLDEDFAFLKKHNRGESYLQDAELMRIEQIAKQSYTINGQIQPILNPDEITNLSIRAGTLNQEEREKIMDHARVSLEILSTLPFPKKYQRVVNIAANHHEKLDGSGYPRGLTDSDIALEDRILILSDLYEALSSQHRPYKDPNPLSQIFNILCSMANEGHIDKKLLKFFYESGTYKQYNQFLNAQQIDEITFTLNE
ncbi:HD domain-containing phosphohydrolase [Thiomicrorhabdus sp. Kp2]|uniref:HD domain-containing phosphohydrolase n=1 Tax=Thiomicrorhabdus sp. Kp2 TaxID=1123518 RepID=UPI0003F6264B|nr:HD domain-containing phosphohydrolase [Thiomicrorhabdus sp. Kp2]